MKQTATFKNSMSIVLALVLTAAIALTMTACDGGQQPTVTTTAPTVTTTTVATKPTATKLGVGQATFTFQVVDKDGNQTDFVIDTDEATVGEALLNLGLIEGEDGAYGLYVKKVNGITADYNVDGTYWAFYVNGEYATGGVDTTAVADGATYQFKVEK